MTAAAEHAEAAPVAPPPAVPCRFESVDLRLRLAPANNCDNLPHCDPPAYLTATPTRRTEANSRHGSHRHVWKRACSFGLKMSSRCLICRSASGAGGLTPCCRAAWVRRVRCCARQCSATYGTAQYYLFVFGRLVTVNLQTFAFMEPLT